MEHFFFDFSRLECATNTHLDETQLPTKELGDTRALPNHTGFLYQDFK